MEDTMPELITNFRRSHEIQKRLHEIVPGGSHTYSKGEDQFPYLSPQIIMRADGAYCWDVDGNKFVDWGMGNRVIILGHNYPRVNEAVKLQIDQGLNFTRPGILEYEVAEYLLDLWQWPEMVKFGKNGSDVTTAAIKLARAYTGRGYVAYCADHPFFSIHDWFIGTTPMNAGVPEMESKLTLQFRYNDIASVQSLFDRFPKQIAALILEPVKNDPPKDDFLQKLREITLREGTLLIFDEMISGMKFDIRGAHHLYGVYPDLVTFGKAISNGYCCSVLAGARDVMELGGLKHDKRRVFLLSQTHSSEMVGLAACRATLEECQHVDISKHVWGLGKRLVEEVKNFAALEGVEDYVRIIGFDCNPQILCTREDGTYWPELYTSFHEEVISYGVLIPWITITYSHGEAHLNQTLEALQNGMKKVKRVVRAGSVETSFTGPAIKPVFRPFNRCKQGRCGRLDPAASQLSCCKGD
jgi:glutamate-1-semialdehyde 2,1-aminomutase